MHQTGHIARPIRRDVPPGEVIRLEDTVVPPILDGLVSPFRCL